MRWCLCALSRRSIATTHSRRYGVNSWPLARYAASGSIPFSSPTPVQAIRTITSLNDGVIRITHRARNLSSNRVGALAQRVDTQVRISLGRAGILVPEQLANDGQSEAL